MSKENLDDYELPYIDFYMEIPKSGTDYLNEINTDIHDDHEETKDGVGLSDEQVSELRRDSLDAASQQRTTPTTDENTGLFSSQNNNL